MLFRLSLLFLMIVLGSNCWAQPNYFKERFRFTPSDTIRGALRQERSCFDVTFYDLDIEVDIEDKTISGTNTVHYMIKRGFNILQFDLFSNMVIDSILHQGAKIKYFRKKDAVMVDFGDVQEKEGQRDTLKFFYHGKPNAAKNPPWDGGFVWSQDKNKNPWVGVSCEGIGASLWWPNKDHLTDEPDSMRISVTIDKPELSVICNGQPRGMQILPNNKRRHEWFISYPINNYNVTLNIGRYIHFSDTYTSKNDSSTYPLDYYVLAYNEKKAKKHFQQVHGILRALEKRFGSYPFRNDGYALVETPYVGMEHQGAIAYGNKYMRGYLGTLPVGFEFDYIILHETGHEWFGNSLTCGDIAEM